MMVKLNVYQQASSNLAQEWKRESKKLLCNAISIKDFEKAVIWCGKGGNVIRSLKTNDVPKFAQDLWDKKTEILNGQFNLSSDVPKYNGKCPLSWTAKIIHIMNPQCYPYIYDSNIRKVFKIKNLKSFNDIIMKERKQSVYISDIDLYKEDSDLWATML